MPETPQPEADDIPTIPFASWLQELRGGHAHAELTTAMRDLVEAVIEYGKPGELNFRVKVKPTGRHGVQVVVTDEVTSKPPLGELPVSLFYVDGANNLRREDPNQLILGELREVPPVDVSDLKEVQK